MAYGENTTVHVTFPLYFWDVWWGMTYPPRRIAPSQTRLKEKAEHVPGFGHNPQLRRPDL